MNVEVFLEKPAKMLPHPDPAAAEQPGLRRSLFVAVIVCDSSVLSFGKTNPLILINDYSEHSRKSIDIGSSENRGFAADA